MVLDCAVRQASNTTGGGADSRTGAEAIGGGGSRGQRPVTGGIETSIPFPTVGATGCVTADCTGLVGDAPPPLPKHAEQATAITTVMSANLTR